MRPYRRRLSTWVEYQRHHGWDIEGSLRDSKDLRLGLGLATMHVNSPERRDHLWLLNAFAVAIPKVSPVAASILCMKPRGHLTLGEAEKVNSLNVSLPNFAVMRGLAMRVRGAAG